MEVITRKTGAAILVVDDDPVCRLFCMQALTASGYRTLCAGDGKSAIYLALHNQPEVVLTDLHLPDISGTELLARIRALWPGPGLPPHCIAMSGDDSSGARAAARIARFDDVLAKPFPAEALLACVEKAEYQPDRSSRSALQSHAARSPVLRQPQNSSLPQLQAVFRRDLNQQVAEIDRLLTTREWQRAADLLHRLSGAAALAGFSGLAGLGRRLLQLLCGPKDFALLAQTYLDFLREVSDAGDTRS